MGMEYRVGDVLTVSCPFAAVEVRQLHHDYVVVTWPWWTVDPDADWIRWDGGVAIARPSNSREGEDELFRVVPPPEELRAGVSCRVGIPPTAVRVIGFERYAVPYETGRLPRPTAMVRLLRTGLTEDPASEHQGHFLDIDDGVPIELTILLRPFAFLEPGDEVADSAGRAWRFDGAWRWHPFDGADQAEPRWPLRLLTRDGAENPEAAALVAEATASGSFGDEIVRWSALTKAEPILRLSQEDVGPDSATCSGHTTGTMSAAPIRDASAVRSSGCSCDSRSAVTRAS